MPDIPPRGEPHAPNGDPNHPAPATHSPSSHTLQPRCSSNADDAASARVAASSLDESSPATATPAAADHPGVRLAPPTAPLPITTTSPPPPPPLPPPPPPGLTVSTARPQLGAGGGSCGSSGGAAENEVGGAGAARKRSARQRVREMEAGLERCLSPTGVLCTLTHSSSSASIASTKGNAQMSKFLSGFKRFQKTYFSKDSELFTTLRNGQSPKMLLIACCDSRVDPAIISDCDPGDLFVVRNVANLVAPYTPDDNHHGVSAALEYAVKTLAVSSIVIMGHTRCGGIEALMNGIVESKVTEFIGPWMRVAMKAKERVVRHFSDHPPAFQLRACEHASILLSLENLVTYPWIRDRVAAGSLSIHGWYFDFEEGEMLAWNADTHVFEPLVNRRDSVPGLGVGGDEGVE